MNTKQYVQHISGQGEKWKILTEFQNHWMVYSRMVSPLYFALPKSAFVLCEPPEEYEDVTAEYLHWNDLSIHVKEIVLGPHDSFRFINHLHNGPAFIVERKKS